MLACITMSFQVIRDFFYMSCKSAMIILNVRIQMVITGNKTMVSDKETFNKPFQKIET